ncbi:unnamed protein product [Ambrosiozyma monospora]|uniref:Unnamed protein product n=1 Tax=Ambrosiozyma monospora TaxID=43982 RepID=A0ACB5U7R4_AMBMO|nr:unnamed protein product [Ambrosiozyma monospora]
MQPSPRFKTILISIAVILMSLFLKSIILKPSITTTTTTQLKRNLSKTTPATMSQQPQPEAKSNPLSFEFTKSPNGGSPLPIFFFSHGGPTFADRGDPMGSDEGAWDETKRVGELIKSTLKPKFIVVVSAHWQASQSESIEVSVPSGLVNSVGSSH